MRWFSKDFIKMFNEDSDGEYFLEDFHYPEKLYYLHNEFPFLYEKNKNCKSLKACSQLAWWKNGIHIKI